MRVSSADFLKSYDSLSEMALSGPVTITRNGRDCLVLMSVEEYERLKRRNRRVVVTRELTEAERDLIAKAEVPVEYAHLDEELKDWKP